MNLESALTATRTTIVDLDRTAFHAWHALYAVSKSPAETIRSIQWDASPGAGAVSTKLMILAVFTKKDVS